MSQLVIVESPAKAKTIHRYLGSGYTVLASMGHVRDLPSKTGSVDPEDNFRMIWESNEKSKKNLQEIIKAAKESDTLLLATDPDREGEAIAWHILEILKEKKALKNQKIERVVFHEITKTAVTQALQHARTIDQHLVEAYLARRALDYLVGFTLSPVLWRKLPGSRSAGRVQSVALRLICDREAEIEAFQSQEYWHIEGTFSADNIKPFKAKLVTLDGKKLEKFSFPNESVTQAALESLKNLKYAVKNVEKKKTSRNPFAPFTTSTLQQEAARKLGFSAQNTMRLAQQLYEGITIDGELTGLITYMRTDSVTVSGEAIQAARALINKRFGPDYVPEKQRTYTTKTKNAQEAHEAIRPTDLNRARDTLAKHLDTNLLRLYELIWQRMVASQMASALYDQVSADLHDASGKNIFRATGSTLVFDGFRKVYQEGRDEETSEDEEKLLPPLTPGASLPQVALSSEQHFTQPPPRFSEATLVKKLEELGIGRPSTYASIISTLLDRKYVQLEKKQFHPDPRGRVVTSFLKHFFEQYVAYEFTAQLEDKLDDISRGEDKWLLVLKNFWADFKNKVDNTTSLRTTEVIDTLNDELKHFLFHDNQERTCPSCGATDGGILSLKMGKFGAFIGCSRYPECSYTKQLVKIEKSEDDNDAGQNSTFQVFQPKVLGQDPQKNCDITLRKGPYGFYVQWEENVGKAKPQRFSVPKNYDAENFTLDQALALSQLPKTLGKDPHTGNDVLVGIGRFGPYIKTDNRFISIPKNYDILELSLEEALQIIAQKSESRASAGKKRGKK